MDPSVENESPHFTGDGWDTILCGGTYFSLLLIRETWIILSYTKLNKINPKLCKQIY